MKSEEYKKKWLHNHVIGDTLTKSNRVMERKIYAVQYRKLYRREGST